MNTVFDHVQDLVSTLCNRRYTERSIAYVESHDQGLVGDQTVGAVLHAADAAHAYATTTLVPAEGVLNCAHAHMQCGDFLFRFDAWHHC
jgi:hypothetical protein